MLEIKNLTKKYGKFAALDDVNFQIKENEIIGLLGANGAGKTTIMNIITGYYTMSSGTIKICNFDILAQPQFAKKCIGYLPDNPPLYVDMKVLEYLRFVCELKGVKKNLRNIMLEDILETFKISDVKNKLIRNLSKGYRQRVGLAQALIGYPKLIILDEPMVGLDPAQILEMREIIRKLKENHTIIISSHILSEIEFVADRVIIINKGKIITSDTTENLLKNMNTSNKVYVRVKSKKEELDQVISQNIYFEQIIYQDSVEDDTVDLVIIGNKQKDVREEVFHILAQNNMPILMMKSDNLSLEEIFIKITTKGDNLDVGDI